MARHQVLNDAIFRAFSSARIPATKEPVGLSRLDRKRPDGLTLIPWQRGKPLIWDVTVVSTLAGSYVDAAARGASEAAEIAARRKDAKYSNFQGSYVFNPVAVEDLGAFSSSTLSFLNELGRRISVDSGEDKETTFLYQRLSVIIQRFNSILIDDTFALLFDEPDM